MLLTHSETRSLERVLKVLEYEARECPNADLAGYFFELAAQTRDLHPRADELPPMTAPSSVLTVAAALRAGPDD